MDDIHDFVKIELGCLLLATCAVVLYRMLTRHINTSGMLDDKHGSGAVSPGRVQLLALTVGSAFYLLLQVFSAERTPTGALLFPTLPKELLYVLGASNGVYLGSKTFSMMSLLRTAQSAPPGAKDDQ
jgi:hypothetical protein